MARYRQYLWNNGEVGDRLTAIRDNNVYSQSSHTINNFLVTDLGNLKIAKKYDKHDMAATGLRGNALKVIDTLWDFYIYITDEGIFTINKSTHQLMRYVHLDIAFETNITLVDEFLFICKENSTSIYELNPSTGELGLSHFKDSVKLPIRDRAFIKANIYQVVTIETKKTVLLVKSVTNPEVEKKADGKMYLKGTTYEISRFYIDSNLDFQSIDPKEFPENKFIVSINSFDKVTDGSFVLDNEKFNFTGLDTSEHNGEFYTGTNLANGKSGSIYYGVPIQIMDNIKAVMEFQNRLVIIHDTRLYFSKIDDYNNFRNGVEQADAFYIRPSYIRGEQPKLLGLNVGRGLYVITNKGIFLYGYNVEVSTDSGRLVTDETVKLHTQVIDDDLYFLNKNNKLYCLQNISASRGVVDFKAFKVEKFDINDVIQTIHTARVGGQEYLVATTNKRFVYLYKSLKSNVFARTTLQVISEKDASIPKDQDIILVSFKTSFYMGTIRLAESVNNMDTGRLRLNPPQMETSNGGFYLNDISSRLYRLVVKMLDQDNQAIKSISINRQPLNRLGESTGGIYSIYKIDTGEEFGNGVIIDIVSNENEKFLEIQATEMFYNERGD